MSDPVSNSHSKTTTIFTNTNSLNNAYTFLKNAPEINKQDKDLEKDLHIDLTKCEEILARFSIYPEPGELTYTEHNKVQDLSPNYSVKLPRIVTSGSASAKLGGFVTEGQDGKIGAFIFTESYMAISQVWRVDPQRVKKVIAINEAGDKPLLRNNVDQIKREVATEAMSAQVDPEFSYMKRLPMLAFGAPRQYALIMQTLVNSSQHILKRHGINENFQALYIQQKENLNQKGIHDSRTTHDELIKMLANKAGISAAQMNRELSNEFRLWLDGAARP